MKKFLFRNVKRLLTLTLLLSVILSCALPAFATGGKYDEEFDAIIAQMSEKHILTDEEWGNFNLEGPISVLDASAYFDTLNSLDMSAFGQLDYEIPSSISSQNFLNVQYSSMKQNLEDLGHGSGFALQIPEMNFGYSQNIQAEFKATFGDLSHKYNDNVSLPEGWDMASLMERTMAKRDEYAVDVKNTEAYKVVSNAISTNKSVTQAITTLETPELKDAVTLQQMLEGSSAGVKGEWDAKSEDGHAAIKEIYKANTDGKYNEDFQALFDEAVGDTRAWLHLNDIENPFVDHGGSGGKF